MNEEGVTYTELKLSHSKEAMQGKKDPPSKRKETPCTIILGIICVLLVLAVASLGYMVFQCHQCANPLTWPLKDRKQENNSGGRRALCKQKWMCYGEKCYYFSQESKNFKDSRKFCDEMDSKLVKIEEEQELHFILNQISYYSWIGLSRNGTFSEWTWEDNSRPILEIFPGWKEPSSGKCGSLTAWKMTAADCDKPMHPICEKKIPDYLFNTGSNKNKTTQ